MRHDAPEPHFTVGRIALFSGSWGSALQCRAGVGQYSWEAVTVLTLQALVENAGFGVDHLEGTDSSM